MSRKRILFCLKCLVLWPVGIVVSSQMQHYVGVLLWWFFLKADISHLSRPAFSLEYWLPLAAFDGFLLGLIPTHQIRIWMAHANARFRYDLPDTTLTELDSLRPALWAWVLPTIFFLIIFIFSNPPGGHSVLSSSTNWDWRVTDFFGSPLSLEPSELTDIWLNKRIFFTQPMLFLIAYPMGVWLRHNLPQHAAFSAPADDDSPLIHSAPTHNPIEPTEIPAQDGSLE